MYLLQCPFHAVTGLFCPGCGCLRALQQLLHGNLIAAFSYNPVVILLLPLGGAYATSYCIRLTTGRALPHLRIRPFWLWMLAATVLIFGVVRNLQP